MDKDKELLLAVYEAAKNYTRGILDTDPCKCLLSDEMGEGVCDTEQCPFLQLVRAVTNYENNKRT